MVSEKDIVGFLKAKIKEHERYSDKPFRVNSIIGVFNRDKVKREWFKDRYPTESQYLNFIHKHKRDFVYDKDTGNISVNRNPCVRPPVFDEYVSGNIQQLKDNTLKIELLVEILKYLKETESGNEKCRGEIGILRDDLFIYFVDKLKNVFNSPNEDKLANEFRMFCMDNSTYIKTKKEFNKETKEHQFRIYLNAFNDRRVFNPNFIDEVFEQVSELAKDTVMSVAKNYLRMESSRRGAWKEIDEICDYLSKNFPNLSIIAFDAVYFQTDEVLDLLKEYDDIFEVNVDEEKVSLKANVAENPQKPPGVLLFQAKGKNLREVNGVVGNVEESLAFIYADIGDIKQVKFKADMSSGEHAVPSVKEKEKVTFNARYDEDECQWFATKITNVEDEH